MSFNNAAAARENARRRDGKFGHQLHSEADVTLGAPAARDFAAPVPGYTGPRVPKGAPMGGMPTWMESGQSPSVATPAQAQAPEAPAAPAAWGNAAPVPGYKGPLTPKGSANGGLPTWVNDAPREQAPALTPDSRALLDADMRRILAHPELTDTDKDQYKAMATALVEKGAGYVNAGFGQRVTFAPGTYYGGRPVPAAFAGLHAKLEADGLAAAERARQVQSSQMPPATVTPAPAQEPAKKSLFGKLLGK